MTGSDHSIQTHYFSLGISNKYIVVWFNIIAYSLTQHTEIVNRKSNIELRILHLQREIRTISSLGLRRSQSLRNTILFQSKSIVNGERNLYNFYPSEQSVR